MSRNLFCYFKHTNVHSFFIGLTRDLQTQQMPKIFRLVRDLSHLIYPNTCLVCERELAESESSICSFCDQNIEKTNYHLMEEHSEMDQLFWARAEVEFTYPFMHFKKDSVSQIVLFNLKYRNKGRLGVYFGKRIGKELNKTSLAGSVDVIIPVPLHPKKEFIRGYNQSEKLAQGIGDVLNVPVNIKLLKRKKHSSSQTNKSRFERWDNVKGVFDKSASLRSYKHVMLVDDVITTGSTIENLIHIIKDSNPDIKVSVVTLAIA